jgi:hypothetical protein
MDIYHVKHFSVNNDPYSIRIANPPKLSEAPLVIGDDIILGMETEEYKVDSFNMYYRDPYTFKETYKQLSCTESSVPTMEKLFRVMGMFYEGKNALRLDSAEELAKDNKDKALKWDGLPRWIKRIYE